MTTEIAVANRLGIALATDSAVTISRGETVKVFDTADKLFELSSMHPVAVMINGNMDCLGLPWEILVKDFRETEGDKPRASVKEWTDDFVRFVEGHLRISTEAIANYIEHIASTQIDAIQTAVNSSLSSLFRSHKPRLAIKNLNLLQLLDEAIKDRLSILQTHAVADSLVNTSPDDITKAYSPITVSMIYERFGKGLSEKTITDIETLIVEALRRTMSSDHVSGIVVAGFGEEDTFPCLHKVEVDGRVLSKLKVSGLQSESITKSSDGGLVSYFAQTDVIERLLSGVDPRFIDKTAEYISGAVLEVVEAVEKSIIGTTPKKRSSKRQAVINNVIESVTNEYIENTTKNLKSEFSREFDRMVAMMPKQELIELAEALVSITAVERKATSDAGTVGGPIDVAFITKHEGLVWIKRKHYFDRSLNPRYFWREFGLPPAGAGRQS